jgi:hypothetical protein
VTGWRQICIFAALYQHHGLRACQSDKGKATGQLCMTPLGFHKNHEKRCSSVVGYVNNVIHLRLECFI